MSAILDKYLRCLVGSYQVASHVNFDSTSSPIQHPIRGATCWRAFLFTKSNSGDRAPFRTESYRYGINSLNVTTRSALAPCANLFNRAGSYLYIYRVRAEATCQHIIAIKDLADKVIRFLYMLSIGILKALGSVVTTRSCGFMSKKG